MFKRNTLTINLIASKRFDNSRAGKILSWCLNIGKIIIFVTFCIIMGGFIYRFSLDRQVSILNSKIKDNTEALRQGAEMELLIRQLQAKTELVANLAGSKQPYSVIFKMLEATLPSQAQLTSADIDSNRILITGKAQDEIIFANFLNSLKKHPALAALSVDSLASGGVTNAEVTFSITIQLKPEAITNNLLL